MNAHAIIVCFVTVFAINGSAIAQADEKKGLDSKPAAKAKADAGKVADSSKKVPKDESDSPVDGKKRATVANPILKAVEGLSLTADQKTKVDQATKEFTETILVLRKEGLTQSLVKKKAEAMKAARSEGKKGSDLAIAVMAAIDATEAEKGLLKKAEEANAKLVKTMSEVLTAEQIATLPAPMQQSLKPKKSASDKPAAKKAA